MCSEPTSTDAHTKTKLNMDQDDDVNMSKFKFNIKLPDFLTDKQRKKVEDVVYND